MFVCGRMATGADKWFIGGGGAVKFVLHPARKLSENKIQTPLEQLSKKFAINDLIHTRKNSQNFPKM